MDPFLIAGAAFAAAFVIFFSSRKWFDERVRIEAAKLADARLAKAAHDLRQPIQAIELFTSALERRLETEESKQIVTRIHACVADAQARLAELGAEKTHAPNAHRPEAAGGEVIAGDTGNTP